MDSYMMILVGAIIVVLLFALIQIFKQKKRINSYDQRIEELWKKIEVMQHDVSALCASGLGVDERVGGTEKRVRSLLERLEELEESDSSEHLQEFQNAIRLAQEGATSDEIVEKCNLTLDEATLLLRLHKA